MKRAVNEDAHMSAVKWKMTMSSWYVLQKHEGWVGEVGSIEKEIPIFFVDAQGRCVVMEEV